MGEIDDLDSLKLYKGIDVIYALYTESEGVRYIGYSRDVYFRFRNHLYNHESEKNKRKFNWINKNKGLVKIKILSVNPSNWEDEEKKFINQYPNLLNICSGGKNNRTQKRFEDLTPEEHLYAINESLKFMNSFYKKRGKTKRFILLTEEEIKKISDSENERTRRKSILEVQRQTRAGL